MLGRYGKGLMEAALAESLYEKGGDTYEILSLLSRAQLQTEIADSQEIAFVSVGIRARLDILYGNETVADELLTTFEKKLGESKSKQMLSNILALRCRIALYQGNTERVNAWKREAPDEDGVFYVMDRYRYMTAVRCHIADKNYMKAYTLLEKIRYYSEICDRPYIRMEVDMFTAVVKYRMGDDGWKKTSDRLPDGSK